MRLKSFSHLIRIFSILVLFVAFNNCASNFDAIKSTNTGSSLAGGGDAGGGGGSGNTSPSPAPILPVVDVMIGSDGIRATSYDGGRNWQYTNDGVFPNDCWGYRGIAYGNGMFVAMSATGGYGRISSSPDGIHWRTYEGYAGADGITYGGGMFVSDAFTSTDGYNFNFRNLNVNVGNHEVFTYINGNYIVSGSGNGIAVSPDGTNFTIQLANYTTPDLSAYDSSMLQFAVGNGIVVGIAPQRIATSADSGMTWNNQENFFGYGTNPPTLATEYNYFRSVIFDGTHFVVYGGTGNFGTVSTTWKSTDGVNWTMTTSQNSVFAVGGDPSSHLVGFTNSNSYQTSSMFSSLDLGTTWTPATSLTLSSFYDFSTALAPVLDSALANLNTYWSGAIASGLASSDPATTPNLPPSVLLTHAELAATACGPNLPAGR